MIVILLATCDGREFLHEQVDSIRAQTRDDWMLIVSDDRSTDGTFELLHRLARFDRRIELLPQPAQRLGVTRNFGRLLEHAHRLDAPYVAFADQDDVWHSDKLSVQLSCMQDLERSLPPGLPILVHTDAEVVDARLNLIAASHYRLNRCGNHAGVPENAIKRLLLFPFVQGCTAMINGPLLDVTVPVPASAIYHDWWCSLCGAAAGRVAYVREQTVRYRQHEQNVVGASRRGPLSLMRRMAGASRVGHEDKPMFIRTLEQSTALLARLNARDKLDSAAGMTIERYCQVMCEVSSGIRRLWNLHKLGIPEVDWVHKLLTYARVLSLPENDQAALKAAYAEPIAAGEFELLAAASRRDPAAEARRLVERSRESPRKPAGT